MIPISAEKIFHLGPLPVTNSVLTGSVVAVIFLILAVALRRPKPGTPRGLQNAAEALLEFMLGFMDQVTHSREKSKRFLPIAGTLFLFILLSNWLGLMPGVGTFGIYEYMHGALELVPIFRPATSDLNMTLAMGITAVIVSHIFGMMTIGFFKHWNKFFQFGTVWRAIRKAFSAKPADAIIGIFTALVEFAVGLIELISEAAKMVSLSLRLFGNIFAGEVLIHVLSSLFAFVMPTPFMFLEVIVGVVQALVFSMLTLVYLTIATDEPHGSEEKHEKTHHEPAAAHT